LVPSPGTKHRASICLLDISLTVAALTVTALVNQVYRVVS